MEQSDSDGGMRWVELVLATLLIACTGFLVASVVLARPARDSDVIWRWAWGGLFLLAAFAVIGAMSGREERRVRIARWCELGIALGCWGFAGVLGWHVAITVASDDAGASAFAGLYFALAVVFFLSGVSAYRSAGWHLILPGLVGLSALPNSLVVLPVVGLAMWAFMVTPARADELPNEPVSDESGLVSGQTSSE